MTGQGYSVINAPVTRHLQDITLPGPPPNVCTSDYVSVGRLSCVLVPVVLPVRWAAELVVFLDSCWVFVVSAPPDWDGMRVVLLLLGPGSGSSRSSLHCSPPSGLALLADSVSLSGVALAGCALPQSTSSSWPSFSSAWVAVAVASFAVGCGVFSASSVLPRSAARPWLSALCHRLLQLGLVWLRHLSQ